MIARLVASAGCRSIETDVSFRTEPRTHTNSHVIDIAPHTFTHKYWFRRLCRQIARLECELATFNPIVSCNTIARLRF